MAGPHLDRRRAMSASGTVDNAGRGLLTLDQDPAAEPRAGADEGDEVGSGDCAPASLGGQGRDLDGLTAVVTVRGR
ncbi:hypothetical protein [Streptomyces sp. S465]|uniref:hypothetical protein n=1 Tax=Streptomyces sp. S465 TaxID=2979468 RepID=UPI0022A8801F|nr:hypothetical protein [Streptomyces sp. S465]WAP53589.1 hypothetical protein N6H00_00725 [Streptomyces sp. S465]